MVTKNVKKVSFIERNNCITCDSKKLHVLDKGFFGEEPHRSMFLNSPWGESPLPYLENCEWTLVQCMDCKQIFHQKILSPEWEEVRFNKWMTADAIHRFEIIHGTTTPAAIFNKGRKNIDHLLCLEKLTRSLRKENETLKILDFGCGWGDFIALGEMLGFETYGIDAHAARRHDNKKKNIFSNFKDFIFETDKKMHAITLFQVLEHLHEPKKILSSAFDCLIPSGILILEVPDCSNITKIKTQKDLIISGIDHINGFTPQTLRKIAKKSGFTQIRQPIAHISADLKRIIKREQKRYARYLIGSSTNLYFRRE